MAGIGDVIAIGETVIRALEYSRDIRNAKREKKQLRAQIKSLISTLTGLENAPIQFTTENKTNFDNINDQLKDHLTDLQKKLPQDDEGPKKPFYRFVWTMQKDGIKDAFQKIQELTSQLDGVINTQKLTNEDNAIREKRLRDLISALTPELKSALAQTPSRIQLTPGTAEWFWERDAYQKWGESHDGLLWINGLQGSGKTGLVVAIGQKLEKEAGNPPLFHLARVYCEHQSLVGLQGYMDIVMSLWSQLVDSMGDLKFTDEQMKQWTSKINRGQLLDHNNQGRRVKFEVLDSTIAQAGRTILILDGLDEVPREFQEGLVKALRDIQRNNKQCRLIITSRPYGDISLMFSKDPSFQLKAHDHDIKLYIHDRLSRTNRTIFKRPEIISKIVDDLSQRCDGTFLMTKLHMDEIMRASTPKEVHDTIMNLPKTASDAYELGMKRLAEAYVSPRSQHVLPCCAVQALFWVAFTNAPMTDHELRQALAIDAKDTSYDHNKEIQMSIDLLCGELLVIEPNSRHVLVTHRTLNEYLVLPKTRETWFRNIRQHIHTILMGYLCLKDLTTTVPDLESTTEFRERHYLLPYAVRYWGEGLMQVLQEAGSESDIWRDTERFLESSHANWNQHVKSEVAQMIISKSHSWRMNADAVETGHIGGLHWAVTFSLLPFVKKLYYAQQSSSTDLYPLTPLGLAAAHDRYEMACELISAGASVNEDQSGKRFIRPPLFDAVRHRHEPVTSLFLQHGADMTLKRLDKDQSSVDIVYDTGYEKMALLLARAISGSCPTKAEEIQLLVRGAFTADLKRAIDEGLDINHPCGNGKNALDYAYELRNEEILRILIARGAVPKLQWPGWRSDSSGYLHNCPEPYIAGSRIVSQRLWGETRPAVVYSSGDAIENYDCVAEVDPNKKEQSHPVCRGREDDISDGSDGWSSDDMDSLWSWNSSNPPSRLLLEVVVDETIQLPIQAVVLETVSRDQGWSDHEGKGTYLGSTRSWFDVRFCFNDEHMSISRLQHNVHASSEFRMHTNIWNLVELEEHAPQRAQFMRKLGHGSKLQVFAHAAGGNGWSNKVSFVRVSIYGKETAAVY